MKQLALTGTITDDPTLPTESTALFAGKMNSPGIVTVLELDLTPRSLEKFASRSQARRTTSRVRRRLLDKTEPLVLEKRTTTIQLPEGSPTFLPGTRVELVFIQTEGLGWMLSGNRGPDACVLSMFRDSFVVPCTNSFPVPGVSYSLQVQAVGDTSVDWSVDPEDEYV